MFRYTICFLKTGMNDYVTASDPVTSSTGLQVLSPSFATMVIFFSSTAHTPEATVFMGKDKFESAL